MLSHNALLAIDTKRVAESIEGYIQRLLDTNSAEGVIIGLSGGIDSAVLTALAVRALGAERVYVYHLYDRDSERDSRRNAQLIADWLGIKFKLHNIDPTMHKRRIYTPVIMRIIALSGSINRWLTTKLHRIFHGESPFMSSLRKDSFNGNKLKKFLYNNTIRHIEESFNARHIYRRRFLEKRAEEHNWLVLGAANRSECMVGWFVKGGIDDMLFSPLNHLYKTQVRQLATYLGVPSEIRHQIPSPDMLKGIDDEVAIGIDYATLDIILHGLDNNLSDKQITSLGATTEQVSHVQRMHKLSAWKRIA
ncbi:MAG: NAD(+) synthase [Planctomycetota bacterium]|jgi:NAD+ synthase